MKNKKGQMREAINNLLTLGIGIMVVGIALAFGLNINQDLQEDFYVVSATCNETSGTLTSCSAAYNATVDSSTAIANVTEKTPTVSKVGVAVVIIGLIVAGFGVYFMKK